jgi:YVTN family beta-propeller protein
MSRSRRWVRGLVLASAGAVAVWGGADQRAGTAPVAAADSTVDARDDDDVRSEHLPWSATIASPIAITRDDAFVWSVNPDDDSVSVFRVARDANVRVAEIPVGDEPWCVAITPDGAKVFVTNMASGTVSVINAGTRRVVATIKVGTEPFGCALTPDGKRLYVANQSSDSVSVIDTRGNYVVTTIWNVGPKPHGVAITADGKKVYVTQFLSERPGPNETRPRTQSEGADDGRVGRVTVIDAEWNRVIKTIVLNPILVSAFFQSDGNTLAREPLTGVFDNRTRAFPNLLEAVVIKGRRAYVANTCSSPNGPFRFNVNVQSCLSVIDITRDVEARPSLNMNDGVNFEPPGTRLFNTNPVAIAFKRSVNEGFAVLAATNRLLRVELDAQGNPTINPPAMAGDPGNIIRIELIEEALEAASIPDPADTIGGKNPRGIVINSRDTRAYVMDFVSRDVAVVDISGPDPSEYRTIARIQSADLPAPGSVAAIVLRGKQLFNTAIGPEGAAANSQRPAGRMSDFGWGTCYSCHPQGLTDSVTWMFADGPRQAISMESTFAFAQAVIRNGAPLLPLSHQRVLNWSAVRDEVQDFTRNIRAVSGGGGLIEDIPEGVAGLGEVPDLVPLANSGRSADLDAIATYLALGVRAPIAPMRHDSSTIRKGRELFETAGCQNCHGGSNWTISILDVTPPPAATEIVDAQLARFLCRVGTFDPTLFTDGKGNEIRANNVANVQARGAAGFNVPSLIAVFASAPYLHSGAAPTLVAVLENVTHRSAGTGVDTLANLQDRKALVAFLAAIDRRTEPFLNVNPPGAVCGPSSAAGRRPADFARPVAHRARVSHRREDHAVLGPHVAAVTAPGAADDVGRRASLEHRGVSLEGQQPALDAHAKQVSAEPTVAPPHAVAGHDQGDGVPAQGGADRPHGPRMTDTLRDPGIGAGLAEGDPPRRLQHPPLEIRHPGQVHRHREEGAPAPEVLVQLLPRALGQPAGRCRGGLLEASGSDQADAVRRGLDGQALHERPEVGLGLPRRPDHTPGQIRGRRLRLEVRPQQLIQSVRCRGVTHSQLLAVPARRAAGPCPARADSSQC